MAGTGKDFATVNLALWGDDDYLDLSIDEQLLFFTLWTSPALTYCGAGPWHAGRLAQLARDWDRHRIEAAAAGLSRRLFLVVDTDTEEYLLRSWIKHDGLWKSPNMAVSMANARAELASRILRGVVVHEVLKIRESNPGLGGWERPAVKSMLEQKAIDPATLPPFTGPATPHATPDATPPLTPSARVNRGVGVNPPANPGPTPAPAPFSSTTREASAEQGSEVALIEAPATGVAAPHETEKGNRLREEWRPSRTPGNLKAEEGRSSEWLEDQFERFQNYYLAKAGQDASRRDWDRTWRNWLKKADDFTPRKQAMTGANLTGDDWDRWMAEAAAKDANNERRTA